jgi:hypothetical protein
MLGRAVVLVCVCSRLVQYASRSGARANGAIALIEPCLQVEVAHMLALSMQLHAQQLAQSVSCCFQE